MLLLLPVDIVLLVLEDYLHSFDSHLSDLDIAYCSHEDRGDWLDILARLRGARVGGQYWAENRTIWQMTWAIARKLRIGTLIVHPFDVDQRLVDLIAGAGPTFLEPIKTLTFMSHTNEEVGPTIGKFLSLFPALEEVECNTWDNFSDHDLKELRNLRCPLKTLNLSSSYAITSAMATLVVEHFGAGLQSLHCDVLDNRALVELTACCHSLRSVTLGCNRISSVEILANFCVANAEVLENLTLHSQDVFASRFDPVITDSALDIITSSCTKLIHVSLEFSFDESFQSFEMHTASVKSLIRIIKRCPGIGYVTMWDGHFDFINDGGSKKQCDVMWYETSHRVISQVMLSGLHKVATIRRIGYSSKSSVNKSTLRTLADLIGQHLEIFSCGLREDVGEDDVAYFLQHCPKLIKLRLHHCGTSLHFVLFVDGERCIANLLENCAIIRALTYNVAEKVLSTVGEEDDIDSV